MNNCPYKNQCRKYDTEKCPPEVIKCKYCRKMGGIDEMEITEMYTDFGLVHIIKKKE